MANTPLPSTRVELEDLKLFAKQMKSVAGVITGAATALPLTGVIWNVLVPPWPDGSDYLALVALTVLVSIFGILFLFLRYKDSQPGALLPRATVCVCLGFGFFIAYVVLWIVFMTPTNGEVHITGMGLTPEAEEAVSQSRVESRVPKDLLDYFGHESEYRIWKCHTSVTVVLVLLFLLWPLFVAGGFSLFVLRHFIIHKLLQLDAPSIAAGPL